MIALSLFLGLLAFSPSQPQLSATRSPIDEARAHPTAVARHPRDVWSPRHARDARTSQAGPAGIFGAHPRSETAGIPDGVGGQYVVWPEVRDGDVDLILLRVTSTGTPASGWPTDGLVVCGAGGNQADAALFPDGAGGVIVGWLDARTGWYTFDIYAQRVNSAGVPQWTANGVNVLPWSVDYGDVTAAPDGSGGLFVAWNQGTVESDIYAVRITGAGALASGWAATGNVICNEADDQSFPGVASDGSGGAVVVWTDYRGGGTHVFAQRVDGGGAVQWTANGIQVDESMSGIYDPAVCNSGIGQVIVAWGEGAGPVNAQRLNGSGVAQWAAAGVELHPGTGVGSPDGNFIAIPDGSGGAVVAWPAFDVSTYGLQAQRVSNAGAVQWGASGANLLNSATSYPDGFEVAAEAGGGAFFVWTDYRGGLDFDIYAQHVTSAGVVSWAANGVAVCTATGGQSQPSVVLDGSGGALISWLDYRALSAEVYSQRLNAAGTPQFAANGSAAYLNPGVQVGSATVQTSDGGALVVWHEKRNGEYDIRARKLNPDGSPAAAAVNVCISTGHQVFSTVIEDGAGGAIVAWTNRAPGTEDIYAQRISSAGATMWAANGVAVCTASGSQSSPALTSDGAGGAILTWNDARIGFGGDVYAQRISGAGSALWTPNGVAVCADAGSQGVPHLAPDGAGGAIIAWSDMRTFQPMIYAQRVNGSGAAQWAANGVAVADFTGSFSSAAVSGMVAGSTNEAILLIHQSVPDLVTFELSSVLRAQKVNGSGAPQWGTMGTVICNASSTCFYEQLIPDGAGGAYFAWSDDRNGPFDLFARPVDAAGTAQWSANGNVVCDAAGWQQQGTMTSSGSDLFFTWSDNRSGTYDVYAHRMSSTGNDVWAADGVVVSDAARGQFIPSIAPWRTATPERLYVSWTDNRAGNQRIVYAARLDFNGASQWTPDGLTSTTLALASTETAPDHVKLLWYGSDRVTATVERRTPDTDWIAVGTVHSDGSGMVAFEDRDVEPGARYGYRLGILEDGTERFAGEAWVEVPSGLALALQGLTPNPAHGDLVVTFTLPQRDEAKLELLDLAGRRVQAYALPDLASGRHTLKLDRARPAPGVYFLRLTQGGKSVTTRAAIAP